MEIIEYKNLNNRFTNSQIRDFIDACMYEFLNREFEDLQDVMDMEEHYIKNGGNFWIAVDKDKIIGTIALENRANVIVIYNFFLS